MLDISPVYARLVLRDLLDRGIEEKSLFTGTTLDRRQLLSVDSISVADFLTFLEQARRLSGDESLGLLIGRHNHLASLGAVGATVAAAPTLREGLRVLESYSRLHVSYILVELVSSLKGLSVQIRFTEDLATVGRFHAEASVMLLQNTVEMLSGQPLDYAEYRFTYSQPPYADRYQDWLHSPVVFDARHTSVELPSAGLDTSSPYYNAEFWSQSQRQLALRLRQLTNTNQASYAQHLAAYLNSLEPPLPDLASAAAALHLSARTLNRRLRDEHTSFREIRSAALRSWAHQYLAGTDFSVEAIAAMLGYQDTANFRRAFRAWDGCSPGEYRRRGGGVGS